MKSATCSNCGAPVLAHGTEPATGRFCTKIECKRARARAASRLGGKRPPRPCIVCDTLIPPDRSRMATCSDACRRLRELEVQREHKRRQVAQIPNFYALQYRARAARIDQDPELRERQLAAKRAYHHSHKNDPSYRDSRELARERYEANNRERINAERRARYHADPEAARARWERRYAANLDAESLRKRQARARLIATMSPAELAEFRATERAAAARARADRALQGLNAVADELLRRNNATR